MFTEIESAIVERLRAKLPPHVHITTFAELARVPEYRNKAPAVFVVYDGFSPADSPANVPTLQQIEMRFTVVVTTKSAAGNGGGTAARDEGADIGVAVIEALIGQHQAKAQIKVEQTIRECRDLRKFVTIRQVKGGAVDSAGNYLGAGPAVGPETVNAYAGLF